MLEKLYAIRGQWSQALEHLQARADPDPKKIADYREKIAERTLAAARMQRRLDVRAAIYRSILTKYEDTPQAEEARSELQELVRNASPQNIRLSKDFLKQYPQLWAPGALGLRPGAQIPRRSRTIARRSPNGRWRPLGCSGAWTYAPRSTAPS